jgi:splicing factor 45
MEDAERARSPTLPSPPPVSASAPADKAMTGEEAYLRRLAMSSRPAGKPESSPAGPAPPSPASSPPDDGEETYRRRVEMNRPSPASPMIEAPPPFDGAAFAPPPPVPPPTFISPAAPSAQLPADFDARVKAQRDAAAAIAARLAAIAPPADASPATNEQPTVTGSDERCVIYTLL